jgi:hypothetical protein
LAQVEAELTQLGFDPAATAIPVLRRRAMDDHVAVRSTLLTAALTVDHPGPSL